MASTKQALRRELRARRDHLAPAAGSPEARWAGTELAAQALNEPRLRSARCVALYAQSGSEIDPAELAEQLRSAGTAICYPRVLSHKPPVLGFFLAGLSELRRAAFGLREPRPEAPEAPPVDVFIVPGLGFDLGGHRIGYGGGFYDAALRAQPAALRIAVGYDHQVVAAVPVDAQDEPVDLVVTPTRRCVTAARPAPAHADKEGLL